MKKIFFFLYLSLKCFADLITLESDEALYQDRNIYLTGAVTIEHALGKLYAQEAHLLRNTKHSKNEFEKIHLHKNVSFHFSGGGQMNCYSLQIDCVAQKGEFIGLPQVHYADQRGEIFADIVTMDYTLNEQHKVTAKKIYCEGHIQLKHFPKDNKSAAQFALADFLEYDSEKEIMFLKAKPGQRVLFFDVEKDMHISAPMVRVDRNGTDAYTSIHGYGDVRMTFKKEEMANLKEHFDWE